MLYLVPYFFAVSPLLPLTTLQEPSTPDSTVQDPAGRTAPERLAIFAWTDFDSDGLTDAFVIQPDGTGHLLHNRGGGQFEQHSERSGLHDAAGLSDAAWTDYDGDGKPDLLWVSRTGALRLWRQDAQGKFVDEAAKAGLDQVQGGLEIEWRDLTGDGLEDLRISTAYSHRIFQNTRSGLFSEVEFGLEIPVPFADATRLVSGPLDLASKAPARVDIDRAAADRGTPRASGTGSSSSSNLVYTGATMGSGATIAAATLSCSAGIDDLSAPGSCIPASTIPMMGALYPMSNEFNVDATTGRVAINRNSADTRLHVVGQGRFQGNSDVSGGVGTGMLQIVANDFLSGLGIDTNEIQSWGADLAINEDNLTGTSINSTLFITTAGSVGVNRTPGLSIDMDVNGIVRAADTIISTKPTGAPFQIASTAVTTNLNADLLDGLDATEFSQFGPEIDTGELADGVVIDAKVADTAAIAGTKISPNFGTQDIFTSGQIGVGNGFGVPSHPVHVNTGSEANSSGGGEVVIGSMGTGQVAIDADELQARVKGSGSILNINPHGGNVRVGDVGTRLTTPGRIGVGTLAPSAELDVVGTIEAEGLRMTIGAVSGHILTSDGSGNGSWVAPAPSSGDSDWIVTATEMVAGTALPVGIGTSTPQYPLHVEGQIVSGTNNDASGTGSVVGGGTANFVATDYGVIGGGGNNSVSLEPTQHSMYATIGGGSYNQVWGDVDYTSRYSTIGGGYSNEVTGSRSATVSGGYFNRLTSGTPQGAGPRPSSRSTISGGANHVITGSTHATISGGNGGGITYAASATIGGGSGNDIDISDGATISGGDNNGVFDSDGDAIGGGRLNTINASTASVIGGGTSNSISDSSHATVPGGLENEAQGDTSFAAGHKAGALHGGTFVWSDRSDLVTRYESTADNQFLVRAAGGVGINTNVTTGSALAVDSGGAAVGAIISSHEASGIGLQVQATDTSSAANFGIFASASSPNGFAGYFQGRIATDDTLVSYNPNNPSAATTYGWQNDVARIRVGGTGAGSQNGFDIQTQGDTSLLRILGNGRVGIGDSTPQEKLDVAGNVRCVSLIQTSDARFKKDVNELEDALEAVLALRGVSYEWDEETFPQGGPGRSIGFLAQELRKVLPDAVKEGDDGFLSVSYSSVVPVLVEAIQEQQRQIDGLLEREQQRQADRLAEDKKQSQIDALMERLASLEEKVER